MSTTRTLDDRHGAVARQLRSLLRSIELEDPTELPRILELQDQLNQGLGDCVRTMRTMGHSDRDIADALGVTRAAVSKRWPGDGTYVGAAGRYRKTPTPEVAV